MDDIATIIEQALLNARSTVEPKFYKTRVIEPGLVYYGDIDETLLVRKEALDNIMKSCTGKPVVNEVHKDVTGKNFRDVADGVITKVWFNADDGWYWHEFLVWDQATQRNCESGAYGVSCAYVPTDMKAGNGVHNNMPYDEEVVSGEYTHLAVVANPRYEGARIIANSKEDGSMRLRFWKKDVKNAADLDVKKATVLLVNDKPAIPLEALIESYKAANPEPNPLENMADDMVIEIDGKEVTVKELKDNHLKRLNAADDDKKKKEDEEKKNAEEAEKKKKEDEEKKNAEEKDKKDKEEAEKKNALEKEKADKTFAALKNKADLRGEPQTPEVMTRRQQAEEGRKRYGSGK